MMVKKVVNWGVKGCCNHEQIIFLSTLAVCSVLVLALWRTLLIRPFKLVLIVIHEASHAIACKLTCGRVEGIEVYANESGKTDTRGGNPWVILPAGYLGASFWGMVLLLASTNLLTSRIAAGCLASALLLVLLVAKTWTLRWVCIGLVICLALVWILQETTKFRILRYLILFIGTMTSVLSAFDIYGDLIIRTNQGSDAALFAQKCDGLCSAVTWGVV